MSSKIGLIVGREFSQRVRKKSFIFTTILTPLLMLGLMVAIGFVSQIRSGGVKRIAVVDKSGIVADRLESTPELQFEVSDKDYEQLRQSRQNGGDDIWGILVIGPDIVNAPSDVQLFTFSSSTWEIENAVSAQIKRIIEAEKLKAYDIEDLPRILAEIETPVTVHAFNIDSSGQSRQSSSMLAMVLAYVFGFMMYMFVMLYGAQVLNGIVEEKSNKVLEVIVCSVRPFQLMMGKILGIAAVAVTQFAIWIVFLIVASGAMLQFLAPEQILQTAQMAGGGIEAAEVTNTEAAAAIAGLIDPWYIAGILGGFLLFFIGGYLLYAAMFAAVGSAVDNVQDSQQLQTPITIPILLGLIVMINAMADPDGALAFWFSIIPFTSPIVMAARLPYGVPAWEVALSLALLYGSFVVTVHLAGKIYRIGIFMYGKKPTVKEIIKWINYKY